MNKSKDSADRVHIVNRIPFRGPQTRQPHNGRPPSPRSSRSRIRAGARRLPSPERARHNIVLGTMSNGELINFEDVEQDVPRPTTRLKGESSFIPFLPNVNNEPIIQIAGPLGPLHCFIDTGSGVDLIPLSILNHHFPDWPRSRFKSSQKLVAANNKPVDHQGRVSISLPFSPTATLGEIHPFIVSHDDNADTMIIGYDTMKTYGIIPIPGSGCLITHQPQKGPPSSKLWDLIQNNPMLRPRNMRIQRREDTYWVAKPTDHTFIPAFKRTHILLKPRGPLVDSLNSRNGTKVLVRECPCVSEADGSECDSCIRSENRVQMCTLDNGYIRYVVDNTHSGCSRNVTPKTSFYVTFDSIFDMKNLAEHALENLEDYQFDYDLPTTQYSEKECNDLFNKTKEEVTKSLRTIIAEPASWSLTGYRPDTLRLINSEGEVVTPDHPKGDPIPLKEFPTLNPCETCASNGDSFCNAEEPECNLRQYLRRQILPDTFSSTIVQHESPFHPSTLAGLPDKTKTMVVGCHRIINKHATAWDHWFPKSKHKMTPKTELRLHKLCDAVITEVSKTKMLELSKEARDLGVTDIHFTNFHAYGISIKLLQRCIPEPIQLHLYHSDDVKVAGPGFDPRRRVGIKAPISNNRSLKPCQEDQGPKTENPLIPPGMSKPIRSEEVGTDAAKTENILTEDEDLRKRCIEMLDSHKKVFSTSPFQCGQFVDPETKLPYLFKIRLKGIEPPKEKTRFVSMAKEKAATELLSGLLAGNIIKRRFSPYSSQSVYVAKKRKLLTLEEHVERGGSPSTFVPGSIDPQAPLRLRHCIDLSKCNAGIIEDNMASLSPKAMILRLAGAKSSAILDLQNAYMGLTLDSDSELVTGFETGLPSLPGKFVSCRASMGLSPSAGYLEVAMSKTLAGASGQYLRYADDVIVIGDSDEQVLRRLSSVLDLLERHGWLVRREKMVIFSKKLTIFGLAVDLTLQTVSAPRTSLDAVLLRPRPASKEECKSFAGIVAWWSETLGRHGDSTSRIHRLTRKDTPFTWTQENLEAYENLLELFALPALHTTLPNYDLPFDIVCDSSEFATGALLLQITLKDEIKIISYVSHIHDDRTARLASVERESYALLYSLATFYDLVAGHPTTMHSDSRASVLISMLSKSNSKICRWSAMLHSHPWIRISWTSSKSNIMKLADWLSRRPAGSKEWKNKQPTTEDLDLITLAAAKLKRDTNMSIRAHEVLTDFICSLPKDELETLEDGSVYIDADEKVHIGSKSDANEHVSPSDQLEAGHRRFSNAASHAAFLAKPSTHARTTVQSEDMVSKAQDGTKDAPERDVGPDTESGPLFNTEDHLIKVSHISGTRGTLIPFYGSDLSPLRPRAPRQGGRSRAKDKQPPTSTTYKSDSDGNFKSVYNIKATKLHETSRDHNVLPENVLTLEEADDLGMIYPASQVITSPRVPADVTDHPPEPRTKDDAQGQFLHMCFQKSPWMRMTTLIEAQGRDPLLHKLREKCQETGTVEYGAASFTLKEDVLLRITRPNGVEHIQICLPSSSGYNLCLKAHIGSTKGNYRATLSPALHNGARKLYSLVSSRFWFQNMQKLCSQIPESCGICSEAKPNAAKNRTDAHLSVVTPSVPGECWSIDLLTLPSIGKAGAKVLTCQCYYSKYGIVIPVEREATSQYLYHLLSWYLLGPQGRPRTIVCDNAAHLTSSGMRQALNQLSIELRTVPIYSGRSNLVEGFNRLLLHHLRLYHNHFNIPYGQWRETLPNLVGAINAAPFSGEMGQKYHLSPSKIFFGGMRASLDPTDRMDFPYLAHIYQSPVDFVKKVADAAWATHQIVTAHKEKLAQHRLEKGEEGNQRFASMKDFKPGEVVIVDNLIRPGATSKLRPRASFRYVVMKQTESSVYCRPWSAPSLERWASAQRFTSQTKNAIAMVPLVKLPKERVRKDSSLHLWTSNSRISESHLLRGLSQDDPEPTQIQVEELEYGNDWLDMNTILNPYEELEPDPEHVVSTDASPTLPPTVQSPTLAPALEGPAPPTTRGPRKGGRDSRPKPKRAGTRRSPRFQKTCRFDDVVAADDGTTSALNDQPKRCSRIFAHEPSDPDLLTHMDDKYLGRFSHTPSHSASVKIVHVPPEASFNRTCSCKKCGLQLPGCRTKTCGQCRKL